MEYRSSLATKVHLSYSHDTMAHLYIMANIITLQYEIIRIKTLCIDCYVNSKL